MPNHKKLEWLLRIGVAGEFAGHGLLAIQGKEQWIKWVAQLLPVSMETAATIILIIGIMDVLVALIVLVRPVSPILLWAAFWGFWTALVRPLVGESWLDFVERAANWAAPLALYYYYKAHRNKE